jgi:hypothetical protein
MKFSIWSLVSTLDPYPASLSGLIWESRANTLTFSKHWLILQKNIYEQTNCENKSLRELPLFNLQIFLFRIWFQKYTKQCRSVQWRVIFAPILSPVFNFWYLRSGLKDYMSKYKKWWCIKICIKSYFNQINTFQHIGINFKALLYYIDSADRRRSIIRVRSKYGCNIIHETGSCHLDMTHFFRPVLTYINN